MIAKEFQIPKYVKVDEGATGQYARFIIEPFERGYGTTIGNSLRRVLLASLEGSAVTAIRTEGVQHEFSAIPGVKEDVTDIVLNFKRAQLRLNRNEPLIFTFTHKGQGPVTAGQVFKEKDIDVYNPGHLIFTSTTTTAKIEMEIKVVRGRGYMTADQFEFEHAPIGTIYLDANFSPVTKVNFTVEDARVGQQTDYDRLVLEVWTNGSITPEKALQEAAALMIDHLRIFVQETKSVEEVSGGSAMDNPELQRMLNRPIEELELSVRSSNSLRSANIRTIGELVSLQEDDMMNFRNFGKKSLDEIKSILEAMGLSLGMNVGVTVNVTPQIADGEYEDEEE